MRLDRDRLDRRRTTTDQHNFSDDQARLVSEPCVPDDDSAKHTHTHTILQKDLSDLLRDIREKGQQLFSNTKINPSACIHARRTYLPTSSTR